MGRVGATVDAAGIANAGSTGIGCVASGAPPGNGELTAEVAIGGAGADVADASGGTSGGNGTAAVDGTGGSGLLALLMVFSARDLR